MPSRSSRTPRTRTLLDAVYANAPDLADEVRALLHCGADPNLVTAYGESALRVASNNGRFDVVRILLDGGADASQLVWTPSFFAVAFGAVDGLEHSLYEHADIDARDYWQRTPWHVAILTGELAKTALLLALGADRDATGRCGKTPLQYAVQNDDADMLRWLIANGCDPEAADDFQTTALIDAAELGAADCVRCLVDSGADIYRQNHVSQRAIEVAGSLDVAASLVAAGDDIGDVNDDLHALLVGIRTDGALSASRADYVKGRRRRFGTANPERMDEPFWLHMIRSGATAWHARRTLSDDDACGDEPVWCYQRFGRTTTLLDDGRVVVIGGEHEDHYDPDFCIYNDVIVFDRRGGIDVFGYPQDAFPPTDFHTATRVGDGIYIVGNLGYPAARRPGFTPVYRLDIASLRIDEIATSGAMPGWVSRHRTRLLDDGSTLRVEGGKRIVAGDAGEDYVDGDGDAFTLCTLSRRWRRSRNT